MSRLDFGQLDSVRADQNWHHDGMDLLDDAHDHPSFDPGYVSFSPSTRTRAFKLAGTVDEIDMMSNTATPFAMSASVINRL